MSENSFVKWTTIAFDYTDWAAVDSPNGRTEVFSFSCPVIVTVHGSNQSA